MGGTVDPAYECHDLVEKNPDIICVSIPYRLGVFGFVHLSRLSDGADYADAQNLGIMDQMQALKWVHENIAAFGGDPDNVTIFGESAGGGSVAMLPLVEGSHKYFKRVIAESGNPSITASKEDAICYTDEIVEVLGAKTVADLKKQSVEWLLAASAVAGLRIGPVRDGKYLPVDAYGAYAKGAVKDIDLVYGCNKDEMDYFVYLMRSEGYEMWAQDHRSKKIAHLPARDRQLLESYRADVEGEDYVKDSRLFSQLWFNAPAIRMSEVQSSAGGRAYAYYFTPESLIPLLNCAHAMELSTVFNHPANTELTGRTFDEAFSKTLRRMWVQFAKTGNPSLTADISPDGKAHEWPLYDTENKQVMVFDEFDIHPAAESEVGIVDWDRTYP